MRTKFLLSLMILAGTTMIVHASPPDDGKTIFTIRCSACHNINKILVGPALAGVDQRRPIDWIINFVHSSQTIVKSGDTYAVALFQKFNKVQMPDHPDLTADNIKSVVAYIKSQAISGDSKALFAKPTTLRPYYLPLSITRNYGFFIGYIAVVIMLVMALLFAVQSNNFQQKMPG